jgi:hypothetical protein
MKTLPGYSAEFLSATDLLRDAMPSRSKERQHGKKPDLIRRHLSCGPSPATSDF